LPDQRKHLMYSLPDGRIRAFGVPWGDRRVSRAFFRGIIAAVFSAASRASSLTTSA
jgi:hypothetical protein